MCRGIGLSHKQALKEPVWAVLIAYRGYMNNLSLIHHGKKIIKEPVRKSKPTAEQVRQFVKEHNSRRRSTKRGRDRRSSRSSSGPESSTLSSRVEEG